jgi:5-methylcytosine-specific restriction endonuclease McrA
MASVAVLDTDKRPLNPMHPARARRLLDQGKAAVFRRVPFTIILKHSVPTATPPPLRLKIDPGSQTSGLTVLNDQSGEIVFAGEIVHRGRAIQHAMYQRQLVRRARRHRHCRYRPARFLNRRRAAAWLPPSLASRVANLITWVGRLRSAYPIGAISLELARFDTQQLQNAEICGVEYQQGELAGYEVREYLLEKWGRHCVYCGAGNLPLQVEHILPRSRGGTDRVSNLTIACGPCNERKGTRTATEFGYPQVQAQARQSLKEATAVNRTRWTLYHVLQATGLPIEVGSGGQTKYNRRTRNLPKTHWLDAACVGASTPTELRVAGLPVWQITATGHGTRQMCRTDRFGFPRLHRTRCNVYFDFRTGDWGRAVVPRGKYKGTHTGRIVVRATGKFQVGTVDGINHRYVQRLWRADGYAYQFRHDLIHDAEERK